MAKVLGSAPDRYIMGMDKEWLIKTNNLILILVCLYIMQPRLANAEDFYSIGVRDTYSLEFQYGATADYGGVTINNISGNASLHTGFGQYKIALGYNYNRYFAVDVYYANLGKIKIYGNSGDSYIRDGTITTFTANNSEHIDNYQTYGINAIFRANLKYVALYAKLGVLAWRNDYQDTVAGVVTNSGRHTGFGALTGIGCEFPYLPYVSIRLEAEKADFNGVRVYYGGAGIVVNF